MCPSAEPTLTMLLDHRSRLPQSTERRAIRDAAGLSREQVARALGVSVETVKAWEGGSTPRPANLVAYVELLDRLRSVVSNERAES